MKPIDVINAFVALVVFSTPLPCQSETTSTTVQTEQSAREIKTLSDEEIQGYLTGKGMGFAKAAELNGYPGPAHVMELSPQLKLTPEQKLQTNILFESMKKSAISVGVPLVEEERKLNQLFSSQAATPELLAASLEHIALLQAKIRAVHLQAHLLQARVLTPKQVALYLQLRGYSSNLSVHQHH